MENVRPHVNSVCVRATLDTSTSHMSPWRYIMPMLSLMLHPHHT
ncbi:hypothetical protein DAI22_07g273600 [Oryza sativa Japonica Group]|nr:hypothetical protein DAI22_07g273600 [Oryza sativa Japonica Group]